jgi:UDP-2,3-diacylglucosamine hydrolase
MTTLPRSFSASQRVVFVSDIHLRYGDQPYLNEFLGFLHSLRRTPPAAVFIHGDLFDFYVGPRQGRLPFYLPLFEALRLLRSEGSPVGVIHGNRDYLLGQCFLDAGCEVIRDEVELRLGNDRVLLSHGDEHCVEDRSYQFWARGVLRSWPMRTLVQNMPVSLAFWAARRYRRISGKKSARYSHMQTGRLSTILRGVNERLALDPYDVVICGHIHHLASTTVGPPEKPTRLLTTGAWEERPNYVEWRGGAFHLQTFDPGTARDPAEGRKSLEEGL